MTNYYDYYTHKFYYPDTPNPFKAPPKTYKPSQAGRKKNISNEILEHTQNVMSQIEKGDNDNGKTDTQWCFYKLIYENRLF